jgi:hypothetical protein
MIYHEALREAERRWGEKAMFAIKPPNSIASELVGRMTACFGSRAWGGPGKKHLQPPIIAPVRPIAGPSALHVGAHKSRRVRQRYSSILNSCSVRECNNHNRLKHRLNPQNAPTANATE